MKCIAILFAIFWKFINKLPGANRQSQTACTPVFTVCFFNIRTATRLAALEMERSAREFHNNLVAGIRVKYHRRCSERQRFAIIFDRVAAHRLSVIDGRR